MATKPHDWDTIFGLCKELASSCTGPTQLVKELKERGFVVPRTTLQTALVRKGVTLEYHTAERPPAVTVSVTGNVMNVVVRASNRILTVDEVIEAANVDTEIWEVGDFEYRKWEVAAKAEAKDITWENGVIVRGYVKSPGLVIEPLFGIHVKFVRKVPIAIQPTIQPVVCPVTFTRSTPRASANVQRALVWCDPHIGYTFNSRNALLTPFHDRRTLDLIQQLLTNVHFDRMDILGDIFDLPEWTDSFVRSPDFFFTTQPAILEGHWWLSQYRNERPDLPIVIHPGNHEARMERAVITHLKAAYELRAADEMELPPSMSIPRLLALRQLGIDWAGKYPQDTDWVNSNLYLMHGNVARQRGSTAKAICAQTKYSCIFGHIHRQERCTRTPFGPDAGRPVTAVCPGCLCHLDGRVPGHNPRSQDWQQGLAIVEYTADGDFNIQLISIVDGTMIYNGCKYVANDRLQAIRSDLPDWNWGK